MATKSNLVIDQGSDYTTTITAKKPDGTVIDLTGHTTRAQMRKSPTSNTAYSFQTSIVDAANGILDLALSSNTSSAMDAGRYLYDVEVESSGGTVTRVQEGVVTIRPEITR